MRSPFPPTPPLPPRAPQPPFWGQLHAGPHARWRSLARMLRARHARHAGRQPLDAVLRRPAVELFQPQATRVSSHLSFNCFVTLKVAPRASASAGSTGGGRGRGRGMMAGTVIRERVMVIEHPVGPASQGGRRSVSSPLPSLVTRPLSVARDAASTASRPDRRHPHGSPAAGVFGERGAIGGNSTTRTFAPEDGDRRVFAAPRGLLQTEEAAQAFGHMVRRLRREESRITPVAAVARRAPEAPKSDEDEWTVRRESTFTPPAIGMGMPLQRQAQADVNIEALASKVMQQIDRRLVAHRERMGRI